MINRAKVLINGTTDGMEHSTAMANDGRTALVTGGTRGLGHGLAVDLLDHGWNVVVCGRTAPTEPIIGCHGGEAVFLACDVRDPEQVAVLVEQVTERHGRLDLLINNAGGSAVVPAAEASPRYSQSIIALNLLAPLHLSRAVHPIMANQTNGGMIINIGSISGVRPSPGTAAYSAAKAGLLALSDALAMEWAPKVRVNALIVGLLDTGAATDAHYGGPAGVDRVARRVMPMGRMVRPSDVAAAVRFLVDPDAAYVTGARIALHGGGEVPAFVDLASAP